MMLIRRRTTAAIAVLIAATALTGCAAPAAEAGQGEPSLDEVITVALSAEQDDALADGTVTEEEYRAGFERYRACIEGAGYELAAIDDSGPIIRFAIPDAAVNVGANRTCYYGEFQQLDAAWQIANEDSSETTKLLQQCLRDAGVEPAATAKEVRAQLTDASLDPETCAAP